jgi:hypothetical protein
MVPLIARHPITDLRSAEPEKLLAHDLAQLVHRLGCASVSGMARWPTLIAILLAACGSSSPSTRDEGEAPVVERGRPDPATKANAALAQDALYGGDYARRTLYTWTTREQVDELRKTKQLLVRDESPLHGATYYEQVVHALATRGDAIARLLDTTAFAKSRFAWHAPWATRRGWPGEDYGDQLVQITLRPESYVLALSTRDAAFTATDLKHAPVALADVAAHPERIAAVYFVSDVDDPAATIPRPSATFREVVVCNESMIESWAVGTDDIASELAREAAALDKLARALHAASAPPDPIAVAGVWAAAADAKDRRPERAYAAALALDSPNYRLDPDALAALARLLRTTPRPAALTGGGTAMFPGTGTVRPPPRVVPRSTASYSSYAFERP